jgi:hypothetical protein
MAAAMEGGTDKRNPDPYTQRAEYLALRQHSESKKQHRELNHREK